MQISIKDLKDIIANAEKAMDRNSDLIPTLLIEVLAEADTNGGSDLVKARVKSGYAECASTSLGVFPNLSLEQPVIAPGGDKINHTTTVYLCYGTRMGMYPEKGL